MQIGDIRKLPYQELTKVDDAGDRYTISNPTTAASIIVLNHVYHPRWYAHGITANAIIPLETVVINDVYQGVIVPNGVTDIAMEFTPWSRWMWLVHWGWLASAVVILCIGVYRTKKG
jgi:hypothetical protein